MRVAVVHDFHRGAVPSGENVVVDAEVAALERAGVAVRLLAVDNDEMEHRPLARLRAAGTVVSGVGVSPLDLLHGFSPDVIHVHNLFPFFGTRWLRHTPCPVVTTQHSFRPMCANGYLFRDGAPCTACPDGRPWSGVRHRCYGGSRMATVPLAVAGRGGAARDPLLVAARRVIVLSERSRRVYLGAGIPESKLVRDWHFVPGSLAAGTPVDGSRTGTGVGQGRQGAPRWLFVGRLSAEKGIARLVAAWPDTHHLTVIGDGPERTALERSVAGRPIDLVGARSRTEVLAAMAGAVGLVFPSLWQETFGLVYAEALSVGLPTLAFPDNVVADAVEADGTGVVASWDDVERSLDGAATRFPSLRSRCREAFDLRYTERAFITRRLAFYDDVFSEHA